MSTIPIMLITNGKNNLKWGETDVVNTIFEVSSINLAAEMLMKKDK
jgi:hypothetical protein